ncbi:hypothetical protein DV997_20790, partial [Acinetobacter baumannii]|uniref:hypothetical protein n=1 Tax=Acinetobacter baumannii TaxID=470 RepID=UPI000E096B2C
GKLVRCEEQTRQSLDGQREVPMNYKTLHGASTLTVTFEAYGAHGVRLVSDAPRPNQTKET